MSSRSQIRLFAISAALVGALLPSFDAAAAQSPFKPSGRPGVETPTATRNPNLEALQLSGISALGPEFRFNLINTNTKKSFWIGLNRTVSGYTITSYDPQDSSVVVEHSGASRRVALRKSSFIAQGPATPMAAPLVPVEPYVPIPESVEGVDEIRNPQTPEEIKQAEYEARMLVSDLLQISMQERERQRLLREQQNQQQ
jgi:hypothetical protein